MFFAAETLTKKAFCTRHATSSERSAPTFSSRRRHALQVLVRWAIYLFALRGNASFMPFEERYFMPRRGISCCRRQYFMPAKGRYFIPSEGRSVTPHQSANAASFSSRRSHIWIALRSNATQNKKRTYLHQRDGFSPRFHPS